MSNNAHALRFSYFLITGAPSALLGQTPQWVAHWDSQGAIPLQVGFKLAVASDHTVYCGGSQGSAGFWMDGIDLPVLGYSDIILAKLDSSGVTEWGRTAGGDCNPFDSEGVLQIDLNGEQSSLYALGWYQSYALFGDSLVNGGCVGEQDVFIARYDTEGTFKWASGIRGYEVTPQCFLLAADDEAWVFAHSNIGTALVQQDPEMIAPEGGFLAKYDPSGGVLSVERTMYRGAIQDAEWYGADLIVGGYYNVDDSLWHTSLDAGSAESCGFVGVVDATGSPSWLVPVVSDSMAKVIEVETTSTGDAVAAGSFRDTVVIAGVTLATGTPGRSGGFVARFDDQGELQWAVPVTGEGFEGITDLQVGPDDAIYVQGRLSANLTVSTAELSSTTGREMYLAKLTPMGGCEAALLLGRVGLTGPGSVVVVDDAIYVSWNYDSTMVIGSTTVEPGNVGVSDFFVAKFDSLSSMTGISSMTSGRDGRLNIYANPSNGLCTIDLPRALRTTDDLILTIFAPSGELIRRLPLPRPGSEVKLDIRAQAKGIYHVELGDGRQRYTGTIVFE